MQPLETQPDPERKPAYFDPDAPDISEQHFAASLEAEIEKPAFVVDTAEAAATARPVSPPSKLILGEQASRPSAADATINDAPLPEPADPAPDWRDQVSAKVNNYKSRKAPKVRYPSLHLQFEPLPPRARGFDNDNLFAVEAEEPFPEMRRIPEAYVSLEATARIIEFPRTAPPPLRSDELADPVLDRPRIVEAPALVPPAPALGGILIEQASEPEPERRPGFDMPLQPAPLTLRLLAGALDALLVAGALAVFAYFFLRLNGPVQQPRLALQLAATLVAVLWPAYQYAFLVFTGTTPGLRLTRLRLTHFDGASTSRKLRRWRVLASLLSCVSLGLGYAWCFLDEDQLSWHDRITRTHIAPSPRPIVPKPGMLNS
jgi:uncharacterized RDD family membrane protein YckC